MEAQALHVLGVAGQDGRALELARVGRVGVVRHQHLPQPARLVAAARGQKRAARAPHDALDLVLVPLKLREDLPVVPAFRFGPPPHHHRAVERCRRQAPPVRRPRHRPARARVRVVERRGKGLAAGSGGGGGGGRGRGCRLGPHADAAVGAARGQRKAVRRPRAAPHDVSVATEGGGALHGRRGWRLDNQSWLRRREDFRGPLGGSDATRGLQLSYRP